jgi:membrane protein
MFLRGGFHETIAADLPPLASRPSPHTIARMARLSDIPKICRTVRLVPFCRRVWDEVGKDNLLVWASALAYSWLFAIFPFFIFLLALLHYLPDDIRIETTRNIGNVVAVQFPSMAHGTLWQDLQENKNNILNRPWVRGPMLYLGLLVALWAASGGTSMTMASLDRCYELDRCRSFVRHRGVALLLTIVVAIMLLAVVFLLPVASVFRAWLVHQGLDRYDLTLFLFDLVRWVLSLVLMALVLTLTYYNGPAIKQHFHFMTPGGLFALIVWVLLGLLFRLYVERIGARGYSQTYGTVAGVAILLFFFYLDALVLLIGAEINAEVDFEVLRIRRGSNDFRKPEDFSTGCPTSC